MGKPFDAIFVDYYTKVHVHEFRLIVEFVGKSDCMSTDFRIFIYGLDIFRRYIQTFHLFALVIFDQR